MKKIHLIAIVIAGSLGATLLPSVTKAQAQTLSLNLNYSINSPVGEFKDFISKTSYRSWTANLMYGINDKISVGLGTGFNDYYEKFPRAVYKLQSGEDISAVVSNSLQTVPILARGQYNFTPNAAVQPYVALGVGGNLVFYRQYLGEFSNSKNKFGFAARPEAGVFIPFRKSGPAGITVNGAYNYMPFNYGDVKRLDNWGAGIGVKFPIQ